MMGNSEAYYEGFDAFYAGMTIYQCRYHSRTSEYKDWITGYVDAYMEGDGNHVSDDLL